MTGLGNHTPRDEWRPIMEPLLGASKMKGALSVLVAQTESLRTSSGAT